MEEVLSAMESLKSELTCGFCKELVRDPSTFGECSHIFCSSHIKGEKLTNCFICHLGDSKSVKNASRENDMIEEFKQLNEIFAKFLPSVTKNTLIENVPDKELSKTSNIGEIKPRRLRNKAKSISPPRKTKMRKTRSKSPAKTKKDLAQSSVSTKENGIVETGKRILRKKVSADHALASNDGNSNKICNSNSGDNKPVMNLTDAPNSPTKLNKRGAKKLNGDKKTVIPIIQNANDTENKNFTSNSPSPSKLIQKQEKKSVENGTGKTPSPVSQNISKGAKKKFSSGSTPVKNIDCNVSLQSFDDSISSVSAIKNLTKRNNKGETRLHTACVRQKLDEVEVLLKSGASPNTKDYAGWCPLHEAVIAGNLPLTTLLLQHGALPSPPGPQYLTPLHEAARLSRSDLVELLLKYGANPHARDAKGSTPMNCESSQIKSLLDKHGSSHPTDHLLQYFESCVEKENQTLCVYPSSLSSNTLAKLQSLCAQHKSIKIASEFNKNVTHLIVEQTKKSCHITSDALLAVVSGKSIISSDWLTQCNDGSLADIRNFSITNLGGWKECVELSKMNAYKLLPGLFDGCHFYFVGFSKKYEISAQLTVTKPYLCRLVEEGGGIVLKREPNPEAIPEKENIIPYHAPPEGLLSRCSHFIIYQNRPQMAYNMAHIKSLPVLWLIECIQNFSLVDP